MQTSTLTEYVNFCKSTARKDSTPMYWRLKMGVELVEYIGKLMKLVYHHKDVDVLDLVFDECGDVLWYYTNLFEGNLDDLHSYTDQVANYKVEADELYIRMNLRVAALAFQTELPTENNDIFDREIRWQFGRVLALAFKLVGVTVETVMEYNMRKLTERHGGTSYNEEQFNNRMN